jgi:uncharacterized protein YijF (DUF1287 family)
MRLTLVTIISAIAFAAYGCSASSSGQRFDPAMTGGHIFERPITADIEPESIRRIIENAHHQLQVTTHYTQDYHTISYPNGDLPEDTGACTDVIIRAFRAAGVDLQKEVHEDMAANFAAYPQKWGLPGPDPNIDHRRVPNLQTFFTRKGKSVPVTSDPETYKPGDVVTWDLDGKGMTHTGLVSNDWDDAKRRYLIIHNIGGGVVEEDHLFSWKITGHYRYF